MIVTYDKHYQTKNLFGKPHPELIDFFSGCLIKGKVLDLGCGQGRNAISLARLGFSVVGVDHSKIGIDQMNQVAKKESLNLIGEVGDIYTISAFNEYDFILLDSMFHFAKNDLKKETDLLKAIISKMHNHSMLVVSIHDTGKKVEILNDTVDFQSKLDRLVDRTFKYTFEDGKHTSQTNYRMIVYRKPIP